MWSIESTAGVGRSRPALSCDEPGLDSGTPSILSDCRDAWQDGVDLTAYKTADIAADSADLMRALGYDKVNLVGNRYGTRVAADAPPRPAPLVRSAVLDAPVPLEINLLETLPATADRAALRWSEHFSSNRVEPAPLGPRTGLDLRD